MQLLTLEQVLKLHKRVIEQSGGAMGVRNQEGLESALAQPRMSYADQGLYPSFFCLLCQLICKPRMTMQVRGNSEQ
ncbi:hypothetical protein B0F87_107204 [Methylobacter tundripaludum]|uniref:Death-on-curing protein n=1 Tax=Methylobacter tundripaludum TaxID=173365 RepID=A0A2S6HC19_9GAMM|nr:Fic family protein [Methylobacter tundripaludum]PPK74961.1 hypothetical protein B0F87_107204 [Methylobacter tundripaludum]